MRAAGPRQGRKRALSAQAVHDGLTGGFAEQNVGRTRVDAPVRGRRGRGGGTGSGHDNDPENNRWLEWNA
ncbi:hypothetical protein Rsph17029_2004 [Rhodobacter sphaeroides ATCC 17029]|nr:hypothetical protein Rsph17029_2004 [Cereibacter sphaeroides ATCC 17029]